MTDLPQIKPGGLNSAISAQIADILRMRIPSLRHIHGSKGSLLELDFDYRRKEPLRLSAPHGRTVQRSHRELTKQWIDMLQAVLNPGHLALLKARVKPSQAPVVEQTPGYLSATTLALSNWPTKLPWPDGVDLLASAKAWVLREGDAIRLDARLELLGESRQHESLTEHEQVIIEAAGELSYFWQRCCQAIAPWLYDGGISEIEFLVPIGEHMSGLPAGMMAAGSTTVH